MPARFPQLRSEGILCREVDDELLIHDATTNQTWCLDGAAATTLLACDGRTSTAGILARVREKAGHDFPEDAMWVALEELKQRNLLEPDSLPSSKFGGLSRRMMLQRLGAAAVLAPVILGVTASPALAQSAAFCGCSAASGQDARDAGCSCQSNNDCCGVCSGGICQPVGAGAVQGAPQCCDVANACVIDPNIFDGGDYCTFEFGRNGRRAGCICASDDDCCGDCSNGLCTAMTPSTEATAHGCCFVGVT